MDLQHLRAWWAARQGLLAVDTALTPAAALERTGWARSVGGVNPYLTLFSRAGISRAAADAAAAEHAIHELPGARGCTYVVPAADFALALRLGRGAGEPAELKSAKKHLGVTDLEVDRLCREILDVLERGPADPAALKTSLGELVRNLGPEGKKRGLTTTLPLALGRLQVHGEILRQPHGGRFDQQRYAYARWRDSPARAVEVDHDAALHALARKYFRWIGPATAAQFQDFTGLAAKLVKPALAPLGLVPVAKDSPLLLLPEDRDALAAFTPPTDPVYRLVSPIDSLLLHRRDLASHLDIADARRVALGDRGLAEPGSMGDLPGHAIVDRGRVVGLWEYDPAARAIAWTAFVATSAALLAEVARTEAYVRDQLGDARSFSLDSPESRRPRIAAIRQAGDRA